MVAVGVGAVILAIGLCFVRRLSSFTMLLVLGTDKFVLKTYKESLRREQIWLWLSTEFL